jgi:transcriptional regulator with XRE-family HTH domain
VATKTRNLRTFRSAPYLHELMAELDRAAISSRIGRARTEAGLSQPELAELLSVHWRTVQGWESLKIDRVPWDRLDEIARATGRTREWLLHGDPDAPDISDVPAVLGEIRDLLDRIELRLREGGEPRPGADAPQ